MITILSVLGSGAALLMAVLIYIERRSNNRESFNKIKSEDDGPLGPYTQVGIVGSDSTIGEVIDDVATIIEGKPYRVVRLNHEDALRLYPYVGNKRIIAEELLVRVPVYDQSL